MYILPSAAGANAFEILEGLALSGGNRSFLSKGQMERGWNAEFSIQAVSFFAPDMAMRYRVKVPDPSLKGLKD